MSKDDTPEDVGSRFGRAWLAKLTKLGQEGPDFIGGAAVVVSHRRGRYSVVYCSRNMLSFLPTDEPALQCRMSMDTFAGGEDTGSEWMGARRGGGQGEPHPQTAWYRRAWAFFACTDLSSGSGQIVGLAKSTNSGETIAYQRKRRRIYQKQRSAPGRTSR